MDKQKLFLDFDSTIAQSTKAFCETYNQLYCNHKDFIPANHLKTKKWNLKDQCPLAQNTIDIFSHPKFFEVLEFMPNAEEVIKELCNKYQVVICSIGTFDNISLKSQWIKNNMPYINNAILLNNEGIKMDKSTVQMEGSVFIDDVSSNLFSVNAELKILYGQRFDWNKDWQGLWCKDWLEIADLLLKEVNMYEVEKPIKKILIK